MGEQDFQDAEAIEAVAASIQSGINRAKELVRHTQSAIREQPPVPKVLIATEELPQS